MGALFPEWDEVSEEQPAAIAAVCARLGVEREWLTKDDFIHAIVGGAVEGERVAWVEKVEKDDGGWVDVDYFLRMRVGETQIRERVVDTYNPYFGCEIGHLRWWDDAVVMVYREKHRTIACRLGLAGAPALRVVGDGWTVLDEVLICESRARGLVERLHLPALRPTAPLPAELADRSMAMGACPLGQPITSEPAALQRRIAAGLPGVAGPIAELLVGALAYRFWEPRPPLVATYEEVADEHPWNTPCWLPFYLYCASAAAERRVLLAQLDAVAARTPGEFGDEDDTAELACRHIASRCAELAGACRAGRLPDGESCYFWVGWSQAAFAGAERLFPAGMWAVWQALRPRARELLALGERR
ncbi:hypothetical protein SAMN02745121_04822 [Nannocystis exedens]|uniref:Uncharacterized protein n=1 Tax=Nannocystis exedens TaxID=54 RepID=A0A1I2BWD6_9BACT|nr:hypothetical protein [Nannocystis exedens]PCC71214.1 hypothetical protein NAEX_04288 [Nannocystis exedens]SFE60411.1 hypothetical protein SAMN02745121_04822 [Nannocystis exedens]